MTKSIVILFINWIISSKAFTRTQKTRRRIPPRIRSLSRMNFADNPSNTFRFWTNGDRSHSRRFLKLLIFNLGNREVEAGAQTINDLPNDTPFLILRSGCQEGGFSKEQKTNGINSLIHTTSFFRPNSNGNRGKPVSWARMMRRVLVTKRRRHRPDCVARRAGAARKRTVRLRYVQCLPS